MATAEDNFATRIDWPGKGDDPVGDVPNATEIIKRISRQPRRTHKGARLVRS